MAARTPRRSRRAQKRPKRWLALVLGLGLCAVAGWFLVRTPAEAPLGDIDAASRAELERVLEQADRESGR